VAYLDIGPIVRITPDELHIKDSSYYDQIYAGGCKIRNKDERFVHIYATPYSIVGITDHARHRFRRGVIGELFSMRSIVNLESTIDKNVEKLLNRFREARVSNSVINLSAAFAALTADTITEHTYGESIGHLDRPDFNIGWKNSVRDTMGSRVLMKHFPLLLFLLRAMPTGILSRLNSGIAEISKIEALIKELSKRSIKRGKESLKRNKTILDALTDPSLPPEQRTSEFLTDEGHILLLAGTETTANALTTALVYLLENPDIMAKLRGEFERSFPDNAGLNSWSTLQKLPYLVMSSSHLSAPSIRN
jgi:cytochrome P450